MFFCIAKDSFTFENDKRTGFFKIPLIDELRVIYSDLIFQISLMPGEDQLKRKLLFFWLHTELTAVELIRRFIYRHGTKRDG